MVVLVEDAFALAFAGLIPLSEALELTSHYHNETEYTVWSNIATNLGICCDLFDGTESAPLLSKVQPTPLPTTGCPFRPPSSIGLGIDFLAFFSLS